MTDILKALKAAQVIFVSLSIDFPEFAAPAIALMKTIKYRGAVAVVRGGIVSRMSRCF